MKDVSNFAKMVIEDFTNNPQLKEDEITVIKEFGDSFRSGKFDWETFERFTKDNKHWSIYYLNNNKYKLQENFDKLKEAINRLLDENSPIQERLKDVLSDDGRYKVKGVDIAIYSAILLLAYPNKYALWNNLTVDAVNSILDEGDEKFNDPLKDYVRFNNLVNKIAKDNNLTLWEMDRLWDKVKNKKNNILNNTPQWWIEKTNETGHNINNLLKPPLFDSSLGKALWSPQKSKDGKDIYANMRKIKKNDRVIHLVMDKNNSMVGISKVKEVSEKFEIPQGTHWTETEKNDGYYVILVDFKVISPSIIWEDIRKDHEQDLKNILDKNKGIFYNKNVTLRQGAYLTSAPIDLVKIINEEYYSKTKNNLPYYQETENNNNEINNDTSNIKDQAILKNIILHGPVGTGKTYFAQIIAKGLVSGIIKDIKDIEKLISGNNEIMSKLSDINVEDRLVKVTFHQSYGYEEFIGGIKAKIKNENVVYDFESGIFKNICDKARNDLENNYAIIIDEINRGDISRIFGELITLIEPDKRVGKESEGMSLKIPNFNEEFSVPENLFIIGTMNDSDRSIALLDVALIRRFIFFSINPDLEVIKEWVEKNPFILDKINFENDVVKLLKLLNQNIVITKGEDFQIGHAFFRDIEYTKDDPYETLRQIFVYKIIPLLKEIYLGSDEILYETVLGGILFKKNNDTENPYYIPTNALYDKNDFKNALKNFVGNQNA
ncbi:MAG: McrB family protein [Thermoplasmata archaeon]